MNRCVHCGGDMSGANSPFCKVCQHRALIQMFPTLVPATWIEKERHNETQRGDAEGRLTDLQQRIQDTVALIRQMEKSVSGASAPSSVLVNIRSLEKRLAMLEQDFLQLADRRNRRRVAPAETAPQP